MSGTAGYMMGEQPPTGSFLLYIGCLKHAVQVNILATTTQMMNSQS